MGEPVFALPERLANPALSDLNELQRNNKWLPLELTPSPTAITVIPSQYSFYALVNNTYRVKYRLHLEILAAFLFSSKGKQFYVYIL